jgi:hypothetical protein
VLFAMPGWILWFTASLLLRRWIPASTPAGANGAGGAQRKPA